MAQRRFWIVYLDVPVNGAQRGPDDPDQTARDERHVQVPDGVREHDRRGRPVVHVALVRQHATHDAVLGVRGVPRRHVRGDDA